MSKTYLYIPLMMACSSWAQPHMDPLMKSGMQFRQETVYKLKVYLKNGQSDAQFKPYHPGSEGSLYTYEHEDALVFKGKQITTSAHEIDSVIAENGSKGIPFDDGILFADIQGRIKSYSSDPIPSEEYGYIQKSGGEISKYNPDLLTRMVQDDAEAAKWMEKYNDRGYWKWGAIGSGAGLMVLGVVLGNAQATEDENGKEEFNSPIGFGIFCAGAVTVLIPVTGVWDFIWSGDPLRAIKAYNREP